MFKRKKEKIGHGDQLRQNIELERTLETKIIYLDKSEIMQVSADVYKSRKISDDERYYIEIQPKTKGDCTQEYWSYSYYTEELFLKDFEKINKLMNG